MLITTQQNGVNGCLNPTKNVIIHRRTRAKGITQPYQPNKEEEPVGWRWENLLASSLIQ